MGRPLDKHVDNKELDALVPMSSKAGADFPDAVREAERHVASCADCRRKVVEYRQLAKRISSVVVSKVAPAGGDCPREEDVEWHEVAAGLWPEAKARQLIMHAAVCEHCGPLLRAAASVDDDPTPEEEGLLAELKTPWRPDIARRPIVSPPQRWRFGRWLVPALATIGIVVAVIIMRPSSKTPISGPRFAEFAVNIHRQHTQESFPLDVRPDSQQALNEWLKTKLSFPLALPASPPAAGEERPYRLEGARLVTVAGKPAVYIAYKLQSGPASLTVTPDSVAVASGGVKAEYKQVTFHYRTVEGYKVVTWSLHGSTYALVSQEGNGTQRSCMICHSAMRDRDLSQTPTPLPIGRN